MLLSKNTASLSKHSVAKGGPGTPSGSPLWMAGTGLSFTALPDASETEWQETPTSTASSRPIHYITVLVPAIFRKKTLPSDEPKSIFSLFPLK